MRDENIKKEMICALLTAKDNERFAYEMLCFWVYFHNEENIKNSKKCLDSLIESRREIEKIIENYENGK